jgi:hypothetical protein
MPAGLRRSGVSRQAPQLTFGEDARYSRPSPSEWEVLQAVPARGSQDTTLLDLPTVWQSSPFGSPWPQVQRFAFVSNLVDLT